MVADLISLLRCPRSDGGALALEDAHPGGDDVRTGLLRCERCDSTYPVRDGVPVLLTEPLRSEVERKTGHRTQFADYQTKGTKAVARLLDRLAPEAGVVLDLGSGRAPYLDVLRGDVICVDLFPPFLAELSCARAGLAAGSMPYAPRPRTCLSRKGWPTSSSLRS